MKTSVMNCIFSSAYKQSKCDTFLMVARVLPLVELLRQSYANEIVFFATSNKKRRRRLLQFYPELHKTILTTNFVEQSDFSSLSCEIRLLTISRFKFRFIFLRCFDFLLEWIYENRFFIYFWISISSIVYK